MKFVIFSNVKNIKKDATEYGTNLNLEECSLFCSAFQAFKADFKSDYFSSSRKVNSLCFSEGVHASELHQLLYDLAKTQKRDLKRLKNTLGDKEAECTRLIFWLERLYMALTIDLDILTEKYTIQNQQGTNQ